MELVGRILEVDKGYFTVYGAKTGNKYKCKYKGKGFRLSITDTIFGKVKKQDDIYTFIDRPWVQISNDMDAVKLFLGACIQEVKVDHLYKMLLEFYKTDQEIIANLDILSCSKANLGCSLPGLKFKASRILLQKWYTERIVRQLNLYGLEEREALTFSKYSGFSIPDVVKICETNPTRLFNLPDSKIKAILDITTFIPTELQWDMRKLAKIVYGSLKNGRGFIDSELTNTSLLDEYGLHLEETRLYINYAYKTERYINHVFKLAKETLPDTVDTTYEFPEFLSSEQLEACKKAIVGGWTVITGQAGSGKSTIIRVLFEYFKHIQKAVVVSSYTGKAVANLRTLLESGEPRTLHSLYSWVKGAGGITFSVIIVDEISMVTIDILSLIFKELKEIPKIILVGDPNQLPPIGWGYMELEPWSFKLSRCFRFEGGILKNANNILVGKDPKDKNNFKIFNGDIDDVIELYKSFIKDYKVQIITPYNEAVDEINEKIQKLNRGNKEKIKDSRGMKWYIGDRVIFLENQAENDVFNGEEGLIVGFNKNVLVRLGNKQLELSLEASGESGRSGDSDDFWNKSSELTTNLIALSYCLTIHKSQGSQWPIVIFYFPRFCKGFTTRNMIYTALTRAQEGCFIIGDRDGFLEACKNLTKKYPMNIKL